MSEIHKFTWSELNDAVKEAETLIRRAESYKNQMAQFLSTRLHGIDPDVLRCLKRELDKFNAQTREWK